MDLELKGNELVTGTEAKCGPVPPLMFDSGKGRGLGGSKPLTF